jgi:hypothetical protein
MKFGKIKLVGWKLEVGRQEHFIIFLLNRLLTSVFKYLKFIETKVSSIIPDCHQASLLHFNH